MEFWKKRIEVILADFLKKCEFLSFLRHCRLFLKLCAWSNKRKMKKMPLAAIVLGAILIIFSGVENRSIILTDVASPKETVSRFMDAICSGDYDTALNETDYYMSASSQEDNYAEYFHDALITERRWEYSSDIISNGKYAYVDISFTYVNCEQMLCNLTTAYDEQLNLLVQNAEHNSDIFENGSYKDEVVEEAWNNTLFSLTNPEQFVLSSGVFRLTLEMRHAQWVITDESDILKACGGKYIDEAVYDSAFDDDNCTLTLLAFILLVISAICCTFNASEGCSRNESFLSVCLNVVECFILIWIMFHISLPAVSSDRKNIISPYSILDEMIQNAKEDTLGNITVIKKVYKIDKGLPSAPSPNPDCYGEVDSYEELLPIIKEAKELLSGQSLLINEETQIASGTKISYYYDETILAIIWKERDRDNVYTYGEVKIADASQLHRKIAGDEFGSSIQKTPTDLAKEYNAVFACSGDFYRFRDCGTRVYNGICYVVNNSRLLDHCYVTNSGDFLFVHAEEKELDTVDKVQKYVDENDIDFSLSFGPILIENGENVCPDWYEIGELLQYYPRCCIGQVDQLHYVVLHISTAATVMQMAEKMAELKVEKAYALDGGQTGTIILNGEMMNKSTYGCQRNVSDIICFASAYQ